MNDERKETKNPNRITIYIDDRDRAQIKKLLELLDKEGANVRDPRGTLSTSQLFRYLREKELQRLEESK